MGKASRRKKENQISKTNVPPIGTEESFAYWQERFKPIAAQNKIDDACIEAKIAEIVELDTPFGRMVDKLNKAILANDSEGIKAAGVEMNNYGGIFTMQEAGKFFVKREFRRFVEMCWDGIGEWRA